MDLTTFSAMVGPIGTVLAAGGYVFRLEGKLKVHTQMLKDRDDRLERIENKVDMLVHHALRDG